MYDFTVTFMYAHRHQLEWIAYIISPILLIFSFHWSSASTTRFEVDSVHLFVCAGFYQTPLFFFFFFIAKESCCPPQKKIKQFSVSRMYLVGSV